jgi:hypothetical protein
LESDNRLKASHASRIVVGPGLSPPRRFARPLALILSLSAAILLVAPARAEDIRGWSGAVLDPLGAGIAGVEVLVFSAEGESRESPAEIFKTDRSGRFRLSGLNPGRYILALNKPGYQILLAQVHTRWISKLALTLIPRRDIPAAPIGNDSMDWILRAPRSDLLKQIGREVPGPSAESGALPGGPPVSASSPRVAALGSLPFNADVEQWYTTSPGFSGRSSEGGGASGRTTALRFDGDLLGHGSWQVDGVLGVLTTGGGQETGRDEGADRLRLGLDYRVGEADSVRVRARYDRDSYRQEASSLGALAPASADQEVRTMGYRADWLRDLEEGKGLEMNVGFLQAQGRYPLSTGEAAPVSDSEEGIQDRRWDAGARYGFNVSPEHRVSVRAQTRLYRYGLRDEGWVLVPFQMERFRPEGADRGWVLSFSGEDAWRISNPLSVSIGLDYQRSRGGWPVSAVIPRLGARREGDRVVVQGQILFRMESSSSSDAAGNSAAEATGGDPTSLGYRAEILQRVGESWTIAGHAERNPSYDDMERGWSNPQGPADPGELLLTDPSSWVEEVGLKVTKRLRGVEGTLGTDSGRVRGRLSARLDGAPILFLVDGEVHYLTLRASALVTKTDTEVRLDYRRLDGLEISAPSGDLYQASRVDLSFLQQVPLAGKRIPADWRVLLAFQTLSREGVESVQAGGEPWPERIHRISGGLGVKF